MATRMTAPTPAPNARSAAVPPIPDGNGNGVLDGDDIIKQLLVDQKLSESIADPSRDPDTLSFPAITIMRGIDTRGLLRQLVKHIDDGKPCDTQTLQKIAAEMKDRLQTNIDEFGDTYNAPMRRALESSIKQQAHEEKMDANHATLLRNTLFFQVDFAHSFRETFKQGIEIKPVEALDILVLIDEGRKSFDPEVCRNPKATPRSR